MTDPRGPEGAPPPEAERQAPPPLAPYVNQVPSPAAPPPVTWAAPGPAVVVQGQRTGLAAAAGIILLVLGILGGVLGLFVAVVGGSIASSFSDLIEVPGLDDPSGLLGGVVAFFGIIVVIYSLVYVIGGIGILRSRGWGRVMGLIVGILSGLVWLGGLGQTDRANIQFTIIMLGIHAYVVVVLLLFWRTKTASA